VFRRYGLGEYVTKRYTRVRGHGLGLFVDTRPHILEDVETPIEENMTIVVHPNTYHPEVGYLVLGDAVIVTADGAVRAVSADSEPELFWALRGGGGNFGVVTSFEFQLHPVGPEVYAGLVVYPFAQARQVLRGWRDFTAGAPDELSVWTVLRKAPPLPFLPASAHGTEVVIFALVYSGDVQAGERAAVPVTRLGDPIAVALGTQPYSAFQTAFDPLLTPGGRNYWKTNNFAALSDAAIDGLVAAKGA